MISDRRAGRAHLRASVTCGRNARRSVGNAPRSRPSRSDLAQLLKLCRNHARRQPCDSLRRAADPIEREVERARRMRGLAFRGLAIQAAARWQHRQEKPKSRECSRRAVHVRAARPRSRARFSVRRRGPVRPATTRRTPGSARARRSRGRWNRSEKKPRPDRERGFHGNRIDPGRQAFAAFLSRSGCAAF